MNRFLLWIDQVRGSSNNRSAKESVTLRARLWRWRCRRKFNARMRLNFYAALANQLASGNTLAKALKSRELIYSEDGKRPNNPLAFVVRDIASNIRSDGAGLGAALKSWVTPSEASVVAAAEASGGDAYAKVFDRLEESMERVAALIEAAWKPMTYGLSVIGLDVMMLIGFVIFQRPYLLSETPLDKMSEGQRNYIGFLTFFHDWGILVAIVVVGFCFFVARTMGRFTRTSTLGRIVDSMAPWSVYRTLQNAIFLYSIRDLFVAGRSQVLSLEIMASNASHWVAFRLNDILDRLTKNGDDFGRALIEAPYQFPDRETVYFIHDTVGSPNFGESVDRFASREFKMHVKRITTAAKVGNFICFVISACWFLFVIKGFVDNVASIGTVDTP